MFDGHPSNIGIYGNLAHPVASGAIGEATCVIAFGASLNPLTTYRGELTRGKQIIQVDSDPGRFGWFIGVDVPVAADAKATAVAMNEALAEIEHEPVSSWVNDVQAALAARNPRDDFQDLSKSDTIDVRLAALELNEVLPRQRTLVHDVGRYIRGSLTYLEVPGPAHIVGMGAFGSIGLGLGGAIGASVAAPDEVTLLAVGDGGLMQYFTELSSAVREKLPLVLLVFNDGAYGAEYDKLESGGANPEYSYQIWPDFVDVARAMGAQALSVRNVSDIAEVGKLAANLEGPLLVDIRLDPTILG
jgi:thiamine pyrophosphate-dependent acetolactate synthase large subunit-like protein